MEQANIDRLLLTLESALSQLKTQWSWVELKEAERKPGTPPLTATGSHEVIEFRHARTAFLGVLVEVLDAVNEPTRHGLNPSDCNKLRREALKAKAEYDSLNLPKVL